MLLVHAPRPNATSMPGHGGGSGDPEPAKQPPDKQPPDKQPSTEERDPEEEGQPS